MKHRGPIATSLQTRTAARPGSDKPWSGSSLPRVSAAALVLLAPAACSPGGTEAAFPNHPIEFASWATPRSPSDLLSRPLADVAPPHFDGQRVTVMTRQGGAGAAGMRFMQRRAADPSRAPRVHG